MNTYQTPTHSIVSLHWPVWLYHSQSMIGVCTTKSIWRTIYERSCGLDIIGLIHPAISWSGYLGYQVLIWAINSILAIKFIWAIKFSSRYLGYQLSHRRQLTSCIAETKISVHRTMYPVSNFPYYIAWSWVASILQKLSWVIGVTLELERLKILSMTGIIPPTLAAKRKQEDVKVVSPDQR